MSIEYQAIATWGNCYKANRRMPSGEPGGIVVHSTGCNNPNLKRYVNLPDICGENVYKNYFGNDGTDVNPHAVIGKDKNGNVACVQILPYNICCWGCGSGSKGSYNYAPAFIQFEICEDNLSDKTYFEAAFDLAAQFCAELMNTYPTIKIENIVSHKEAAARGYASAHGDPENWLSKFGKDMNWFRDKVKGYLKKDSSVSSITDKTVNFTPRTTAPNATDKHWLHTSKGGLNECIHISGDSVLPNCVGYAWGRFYELTGEKPRLSKGNAEDWYGNTSDGYKRSATPQLGAVACWRKGQVWNSADGCGHVAVVEEIKPNGDIVCSNSAYGGTRFYMKTYSKSTGYNDGALTFQGFILPFFTTANQNAFTPYTVRVKVTDLNIRLGAGTNYPTKGYITPSVYTIVAESDGQGAKKWGKLKSGAGWIALDFVEKV